LFLEVAETCRKDCPEGILEVAGYSRRIMRNAFWLKELNTKRCKFLDSTQPDPSKSPDKIPQPNTSNGPDTEKRQQPDGRKKQPPISPVGLLPSPEFSSGIRLIYISIRCR
jgi:hypothetical protein